MFPMSDKNLVKYHISPEKIALSQLCVNLEVIRPLLPQWRIYILKFWLPLSVQFSFSWSFQENLTKQGIGAPLGNPGSASVPDSGQIY